MNKWTKHQWLSAYMLAATFVGLGAWIGGGNGTLWTFGLWFVGWAFVGFMWWTGVSLAEIVKQEPTEDQPQ